MCIHMCTHVCVDVAVGVATATAIAPTSDIVFASAVDSAVAVISDISTGNTMFTARAITCDTTVVIQVPRWAVGPFEHACPVYFWFVVGSSYQCVVPPISEVEFHGDVRCYVIWY